MQFHSEENAEILGLSGHETFDILGLADAYSGDFATGKKVTVRASREQGAPIEFSATVRIDTEQELLYYKNGGILQYVLRGLLSDQPDTEIMSKGVATMGAE